MPNFSAEQKRLFKTTIDPQEVGHDLVLAALDHLIPKMKSEAGAIRRLLYIGANAYFGKQVVADAQREKDALTRQYPRRKQSSRLKATGAVKKTVPSAPAATPVVQKEPTPPPAAQAEIVIEPPAQSAPPVAGKTAGGGLMKLRHMALSQSVAPPEASAPRPAHRSAEGQSLSPAVLASTLAKMKVDGREF